ncbi:1,2-phenylacetyl-CoA epoxidase subunit PaaB [Pseudomonas fontis]|uniref:1,2-phenylacetyl-CoA epoxidase subunit B n=1 Tax=Pseudomonas fontis TaxID=2942633 RepID=A0ABT5NNE7_9PSED|nr:1,2-phenylacetyl-CoA epoxidase subunit PaaB [Pseudomonas fontis]MDD0973168.1 1,2-phenylacetyl-CoA epoxidase subunit B [Pseudomonas fontis]MDD0989700.1 1,2-phenylacetyl-CoA epoxidase subunit B [Pseudomonas fontis]
MPNNWKTWEVFVRSQNGIAHRHIGSVQASDADMALRYARDVYTRRDAFVSLWLVASEHLISSAGQDQSAWFETAHDKGYRQATFYPVPDGVQNL